jgi:hypothetical protein
LALSRFAKFVCRDSTSTRSLFVVIVIIVKKFIVIVFVVLVTTACVARSGGEWIVPSMSLH